MLYDNLAVNEKGHLTFAGADTVALAEKYGTPLYLLDEERIRSRCRLYLSAMREHFGTGALPLYAGKALCFRGIYRIMKEEGMGIDLVSPGEIYTAFAAGFPMVLAYFHGNGKTPADIAFAMDHGVGTFVCDGKEELAAIDEAAAARGIRQQVLLRLSPGIDPHTHAKISTGRVDCKFGTPIATGEAEVLTRAALSFPHIALVGYHCHIGSQIFDVAPFLDAARVMLGFIARMKVQTGWEATVCNLGGGMGVPYVESDPTIDYEKNIAAIGKTVKEECAALGIRVPDIRMEPGRSIVADAGITLYTAGGKKEIPGVRNYLSIDGGMADNPRYTLYGSAYTVLNATRADKPADYVCTVAGRCCESGDLIQENVRLPEPAYGDILAVLTTGAYNYAMASHYNVLPKPPIVFVGKGGADALAVRRETFGDLLRTQL